MAVRFELNKSSNGQFHFSLKSENDHVILQSEQYESKASAQSGIASVQANSPQDARYERKLSSDGKPYFNLTAANHQIIGTSLMFGTEQARDDGVALVKANAQGATVKDNT